MSTAINVVLLNLAPFLPFASYSLCFICGVFIYLIAIEIGNKDAFIVYFVVSVISFFSIIYNDAALLYVLVFGYYPIIKNFFDGIKIKVLRFFLILFFNFALSWLIVNIAMYIFLVIGIIKIKQLNNFYVMYVTFFANFVIITYNFCLSMFKRYYFNVFKMRYKLY